MKLHNIKYVLDSFQIPYEDKNGKEVVVKCVFHDDTNPSCNISLEKGGVFHCKSCGEGGALSKYISKFLDIPEKNVVDLFNENDESITLFVNQSKVYEWHNALLAYPAGALILFSKKGITKKTIEQYRLGWDGERFTIPIFDSMHNCINVRRWSHTDRDIKYLNLEGFGENSLYPYEALAESPIYLTEGEFKALLLRQYGFNAICATAGASSWDKKFSKLFQKKKVYVIYDIDLPGRLGANKVCEALLPFASEVYNVVLPLDPEIYPTGDVTDFFIKAGKTRGDFLVALEEAKRYTPKIETEKDDTTPPVVIPLSDVTKKENSGLVILTKGLVAGKHLQPYLVPRKYSVNCAKAKDYCALCPVYRDQKGVDDVDFEIFPSSASNLDLINSDKKEVNNVLKAHSRIPHPCKEHSFRIKSTQNIEEIRLIPEPGTTMEFHDSSMTVTKGYAVGHGIETNQVYTCSGKIYPDPRSQQAVLLITSAEKAVDSISSFVLTDDIRKKLEVFRPREWTLEGITEKFKDIYEDYSCNVTKIYSRPLLHIAFDLVFHSALFVEYNGKRIKGWVEGILIGDTGTGKTEVCSSMRNFYGLGKTINCETTSTAGLLGGLTTDFSKRMVINWGELVLNDCRAIILEEASGLKQDALSVLTEVRSSGTITITKVEKMIANARVRMLWISNPRSNRNISTYNYGVDALKELIGAVEDIRRFDFAMFLSIKDVESKWLNIPKNDAPRFRHTYTADISRALVLWVWSRKPNAIKLEYEAEKLMLEIAEEMSQHYSPDIPLVSGSDQRLKILRLAISVAAKTFSSDEEDNIIVKKCHVEYVRAFLNSLYTSEVCGYYEYSKHAVFKSNAAPKSELHDLFLRLPNPKSIVITMLSTQEISVQAVAEWTGLSREEASAFIQNLTMAGCVKRVRHNYYKTEYFINVLREMLKNDNMFTIKPVEFTKQKNYEF